MNIRNKVYKLEPILDNPKYEGFGCAKPGSFPDSLPRGRTTRDWQIIRLTPTWKPIKVVGRVRKFNDYPCVGMSHPAFSERAIEVLRDFLEPNGEILPLSSSLGSYFHFNITTVADVLDWKHSEIRWGIKPITASTIERYEFFPKKLEGLTIFQIPELPSDAYVTEAFVDRVHKHKLEGFNFEKVWPMPPGVIWWQFAKEQKKRQQREGLPEGQWVKGNTVVIQLKLADQSSKGTKAEKEAVSRLMDQLDTILVDVESREPAVGSLEGNDYVTGQCRLFLSCPDADALIEKLQPWLNSLKWRPGFSVLKRYGEYVDPNATEVRVEL